jgi:hypothetical protein
MIGEIQLFFKLKIKYFRQFWSLINLGIIVCSWTSLAIYIWRYQQSIQIGDLLEETNGYVYINLQLPAYVNDIYIYLLGFCCFFGTIKFVHLCRFSPRVCLFLQTFQYASQDLLSFAIMFLIVFLAFVILFYLLFVSKLSSCSSLFQTAEMLFQMILMQFDAYELSGADAFLGPFCLSLFIFIIVFVFMSVFLTIINQSFRFVRKNATMKSKEDQDMLSFMLYKFQRWLGVGKSIEFDRLIERDEQMRSKYFDPIEHFPDKIDQLLEALNRVRVYFSSYDDVHFLCLDLCGSTSS